jgi:hypothetical protein
VGRSNSSRISLIVSRSCKTSEFRIPFSGKVGNAGCVNLPALQNISQDATCFIIDVIVCKLPADRHHLKMLPQVPMKPQKLDNLFI